MGILKSLFGRKIENENKSKPFYMNSTPLERKDWFSRTRPWDRIDPKTIDALINKFGDNRMFEVFVVTSMQHFLLCTQYQQLNNKDYSETVICSQIAAMLCEVGKNSAKRLIALEGNLQKNIEEVKKHYSIVRNTLDPAIILDENQIAAYTYLAHVYGLMRKFEEGLHNAKQGIAVIQRIRESNPPFHLSDIDTVRNADETMEVVEETLKQLVEDYEKRLG